MRSWISHSRQRNRPLLLPPHQSLGSPQPPHHLPSPPPNLHQLSPPLPGPQSLGRTKRRRTPHPLWPLHLRQQPHPPTNPPPPKSRKHLPCGSEDSSSNAMGPPFLPPPFLSGTR